jgi:raffinose/stachyose/melibiose transport system substrate-binding protein
MKVFAFTLAAMAAISFTACGGGGGGDKKLRFYYYKQEIKDALREMCDAFTNKNPDIEIDLEVAPNDGEAGLKTGLLGGTGPDLIQLQSYSAVFEFAKAGYLADLTTDPVMAQVVDSAKGSVTYKGKQYAVPMDLAGIGIIYNKKIFAKFGLKPPTTLSELKTVCATLKKNKVTPFAGLLKENWSVGHFLSMVHTTLAGSRLTNWMEQMNEGKASFADPVNKKDVFALLDFYKNNMDPRASEFGWNEQQAAFAKGEAAMMVQGLWSYGAALNTETNLDCGFIAFPCNDNVADTKLFVDVDSTIAVNAGSSPDKIKKAKRFLAWIATPEGTRFWVEKCKLVPTFKNADISVMKQPFQDLVSYVKADKVNPWAFSSYPVSVWEDAVKNGAQEYLFGKKNADQVISYIDSSWKKAVGK